MATVSVDMAPNSSPAAATLAASSDDESQPRICGENGCGTVLSLYNHYEFCSLHQPMIIPRLRGKVLDD